MKSVSLRNYLIVSLSVHLLVMGTFYISEKLQLQKPEPEAISITLLPPPTETPAASVQKPAKQVYRPANQIVEQSDQSPDQESPDARFLSAKNQKVEKQTVAANRGDFQNTKKAASAKGGSNSEPEMNQRPPLSEAMKKQIAQDLLKGFDAKEAFDRQKVAEHKNKGLGDQNGTGQEPQGDTADSSQTNDYIKDVEVGLETVLNTREFKYYSYYNRIRRQLSQHWEGRVRDKLSRLFREGRAPAATNQDRITKLMIVLNEKGTLVRVQVLSDSGIRDLDDAAIEAFRAAAPFPNPPQGIVEKDGTVKIRWDFVLEV